MALSMAKTPLSFGHYEYNRVRFSFLYRQLIIQAQNRVSDLPAQMYKQILAFTGMAHF